MANVNIKRNACRLCKSTALTVILKLTPTPIADEYVSKSLSSIPQACYPLNLVLCKKCGHVQLQNVILPKNIYINYIYETATSLGLVNHFLIYSEEVLRRINPVIGSLIIDIGSNDGTFLNNFKTKGFRVLGIDPAKKIAAKATQSGIPTLPQFFTLKLAHWIKKKFGQAAIITANNIFANIDDLEEFIKAVKKLLMPDGVFILETFYLLDFIKNKVFDFTFHEHLSYFSVTPLIKFFKCYDMEIIDVIHVPTKAGSLRITVQFADGAKKISSSVAKYTTMETSIGLQKRTLFKSYKEYIDKIKTELLKILDNIKKENKTIVGYGASATSTTLLYHFDLNDKLQYLIDDNPKKIGVFSPGYHLPVLSPEEVYKRRIDYILVLAWRYATPIINGHKKFLKQGGHFIVPLPTIQII